jgi:hypothetical protein
MKRERLVLKLQQKYLRNNFFTQYFALVTFYLKTT